MRHGIQSGANAWTKVEVVTRDNKLLFRAVTESDTWSATQLYLHVIRIDGVHSTQLDGPVRTYGYRWFRYCERHRSLYSWETYKWPSTISCCRSELSATKHH